MPVISWESDAGELIAVTFDVVEYISRTTETTITEHPVEEGSEIADHAFVAGMTAELNGYVSNTPLYSTPGGEKNARWESVELPGPVQRIPVTYASKISTPNGSTQSLYQGAADLIGGIGGTPKATMLVRDWVSRVKEIEELLREAQASAKLCTLEDSEQSWDNLLITNVGATRTLEDGDGASFALAVKQIRTASSELIAAPEPLEPRGSPLKSLGSKAAASKAGDPEKEDELLGIVGSLFNGGNKSILASGLDAL